MDRQMLALAVPALLTLTTEPLVSLVDTAFVGMVGTRALAAVGVSTAAFNLAFFAFNFLAYATTPRIARALAVDGRNSAEAHRVAGEALVLAAACGVVVALGLALGARTVAHAFGASGDVENAAVGYLRVRALSAPAVLLLTACHGIFRGRGDTRVPLVVTVVFSVVNLVLDPVLMFVAGLGLLGAAWASTIAQWLGASIFLGLIIRQRRARPARIPLQRLRYWLTSGGVLSIRTLTLLLTLSLSTRTATRHSVEAAAAHQIAIQLWFFMALVIDSIAVAGQTLIAGDLGAKRFTTARSRACRMQVWGALVGGCLGLALAVAGPDIGRLFTNDRAALAQLSTVFGILIVLQPLSALVFALDGVLMGAEDFRFLAGHMLFAGAVAGAALIVVDYLSLGLWWVWTALVILTLCRLGAQWWRVYATKSLLARPVS